MEEPTRWAKGVRGEEGGQEGKCIFAEAILPEVISTWPRCSGEVFAVDVSYRGGRQWGADCWWILEKMRKGSSSGELFLCEGHIDRIRDEGVIAERRKQ